MNLLTIITEGRRLGCCIQSYQITFQKNQTFSNSEISTLFYIAIAHIIGAISESLQSYLGLFILTILIVVFTGQLTGDFPRIHWAQSNVQRSVEELPKTLLLNCKKTHYRSGLLQWLPLPVTIPLRKLKTFLLSALLFLLNILFLSRDNLCCDILGLVHLQMCFTA